MRLAVGTLLAWQRKSSQGVLADEISDEAEPAEFCRRWTARRSFLHNHMHDTAAIDMFVVVTARFRLLYALVVLGHERRKVIHFDVTLNPHKSGWRAKSPRPFPGTPRLAFCCEIATLHMGRPSAIVSRRWRSSRSSPHRDRRGRMPMSSASSARSAANVSITSSSSMSVICAVHCRHILSITIEAGRIFPEPRPIQPPSAGTVVAFPHVGGLHHRYERRAA